VQANTPDELRGRVMSIYVLVFFGTAPLGALLTGGLGELLGTPLTVAFCALAALATSVLVWLKVPRLRAEG